MDFNVHFPLDPGSVALIQHISTQLGEIMASVQQVKDALAAVSADVTRETTVINSSIVLQNGQAAVIADLTSQLAQVKADLAAAGANTAALDDVIAGLGAVHTTMKDNADREAANIVANS